LHKVIETKIKSRNLQEQGDDQPKLDNDENDNPDENIENVDPDQYEGQSDFEFNKTIRAIPIIADGTSKDIQMDTCDTLALPLNFHKMDLQIKILGNIHRIMITDKKIDSCKPLEEFECPIGSRICSSMNFPS
jgi:hypothetical protein